MDPLAGALAAKIQEQVDRTLHLIGLIPADRVEFGDLLGHLLDCFAGICAVLYAANPEKLAHFAELRSLPVNFNCSSGEARGRIARYGNCIEEGFAVLRDSDLGRRLPTVFVPDGELVLTLLLGNLEHVINHKHQLFTCLKMLPVEVGTPDLYCFRR